MVFIELRAPARLTEWKTDDRRTLSVSYMTVSTTYLFGTLRPLPGVRPITPASPRPALISPAGARINVLLLAAPPNPPAPS